MVARYAQQEDVPLCLHVAESPFENEALLHGRGPTHDFARKLGPVPHPRLRSVAYLAKLGVLEAKPLLAHVVNVNDDELAMLAQSGAKVVHCPRSNLLLQCGRMPLEKMLALGIPVALGTDSVASSPSLDVREEAETAVSLHHPHLNRTQIMPLLQNSTVLA
jgi:cytosine/adenosine deaminase-related metal-dependent hydrolase